MKNEDIDIKYMRMALDEAHKALERDEVPIGAVIVCTLYVTVEPCLMCAGALAWSQIPRIVYGASDDKRGYHTMCASPFHPKTTVTGGILGDECAKLMTDFFKKKRPLKIKEK